MKFNKKVLKKLFGILTMIMIIVTIYEVSQTYALLHSENTATITSELGNWYIKINDVDIVDEVSKNILVNGIVADSSENVKPGKIAPGLQGYFNLNMDTASTSVAIRYDITIENIESILDLISIKNLKTDTNLIKTDKNTYSGVINLDSVKDLTSIQIYILWNNENETDEKNSLDTEIGIQKNASIKIPVSIEVSQYLGEELVEYIEETELPELPEI